MEYKYKGEGVQGRGRDSHPRPSHRPRRNAGLLHVCTRGRQHKAQKEIWPVSGLQDHRYLSVNK